MSVLMFIKNIFTLSTYILNNLYVFRLILYFTCIYPLGNYLEMWYIDIYIYIYIYIYICADLYMCMFHINTYHILLECFLYFNIITM